MCKVIINNFHPLLWLFSVFCATFFVLGAILLVIENGIRNKGMYITGVVFFSLSALNLVLLCTLCMIYCFYLCGNDIRTNQTNNF